MRFNRAVYKQLIKTISETNGISLFDTLELCLKNPRVKEEEHFIIHGFIELLNQFQSNKVEIESLLEHPVSFALEEFFRNFPLKYREEHIHLTGSLSSEFVFPKIKPLLEGPDRDLYEQKLKLIYGDEYQGIESAEDVDQLIRLRSHEAFERYLQILFLPKVLLVDEQAHIDAAYHMANELYHQYNVGFIRLKFTLSRASTDAKEQIPGLDTVTEEDVVVGLFKGFKKFQEAHSDFEFALSPCFRKESGFFDSVNFTTKRDHFNHQVDSLIKILEKHPEICSHVAEVDTVGSEKDLYRKVHFEDMKFGFRKLQYLGFAIRSHHGETWHTLRKGVQAVDNAMNIWRIDTLEHGLSLGINPNYYFHSLYQSIMEKNSKGEGLVKNTREFKEILEMNWRNHEPIRDKILQGDPLDQLEEKQFIKTKFHAAREIESYQHDVLNRMIQKGMSLIALPTSNKRLTGSFKDFKEHPFSWWEKKGVKLGIGTDNYITLNTNYIQELLIMLYTDAHELKLTKLLMVATGETRRPYISQLLWKMREKEQN